jgi:hypothetical protein
VSLHYIIRIAHNLQAFPTSCTSVESLHASSGSALSSTPATLLGNLLGGQGKSKAELAATASLYVRLRTEKTMKHAVRTIGSAIRASKYDMETKEEFVRRRHKRKLDIATLIEKPLITHGSDWTHFQGSPTLTVSAENRRTLARYPADRSNKAQGHQYHKDGMSAADNLTRRELRLHALQPITPSSYPNKLSETCRSHSCIVSVLDFWIYCRALFHPSSIG